MLFLLFLRSWGQLRTTPSLAMHTIMQIWVMSFSLMFTSSIRKRKRCDPSDCHCGMVVGAKQGGLSISETADLLGFSHTTVSRVCNECCGNKTSSEQQFWGHKRIGNERARLVKAGRKLTVTQITTHYKSGMHKSISRPSIPL